jgi:CheY-like chemotaxis protein
VLINLLGNAVKFTEHGGVILRVFSGNGDTPAAETNHGHSPAHGAIKLVLEVEDTGVGIREQDMEKVFQPFEQVGSGENGEGGTGLGLAISREFVGVMGGTISVASREGQGSAFRIAIPIRPGNEKADNGRDRKRRVIALEPGQPQFRILVVDDIQTNRDILCSMLIAVGLDVRTADNGEQAVAAFDLWRPHAVLMDMKMPVMDGRQATKAIRARPGGKQTVVIAVSAGAWEEEIKDVLAEGPDDFIRKPFREEDVLDALRDHLGIKFTYEQDDREGRIGDPSEMKRAAVGPDTFDNLPRELIDEIVDATISLDVERLTGLVPRVRAVNPSAAVAMSRLLKQYEFEALLDALEVREEAV